MPTAASKLRALLADPQGIIVCPGVYDGFTARIALRQGFDCLYMTGAGTVMSRLGIPDIGLATLNDMRDNAAMIAALNRDIPLIADADAGYGGPLMVGRTVSQYMAAGVAALHLEDQVVHKRCGHLKNKPLVSADVFLSRIRAAINARDQNPGDIVVIARTDALQSLGYDAAIDRLKQAIAVGADVAFLEGITSKEEARNACRDLAPTPVLFNNVPGGVSPVLSVDEAKELGFKLIIFPGVALHGVYTAVTEAMKTLKEKGKQEVNTASALREVFEVCGLDEMVKFDIQAGGNLYTDGV